MINEIISQMLLAVSIITGVGSLYGKDKILGGICYNENCHQENKSSKTVFAVLERQGMLLSRTLTVLWINRRFYGGFAKLMAFMSCELILPSKGFNVVLEQQRCLRSVFK